MRAQELVEEGNITKSPRINTENQLEAVISPESMNSNKTATGQEGLGLKNQFS